jgi:hypothetical protein
MWVWVLVVLWALGWVSFCKYQQRKFDSMLSRMDPKTEFNQTVMMLCGHEMPLEFFLGINLAFYRTFVSPTISGRYYATRAIQHHTLKRVDDTDILMHAWCDYGTDSDISERSFNQLNRIHGMFVISNKDFVFVLCCFVVDTIRMTELTARREMSFNEKQAHFKFWMEVGKKMNLIDLPTTLEEAYRIVEDYVNSDQNSRETEAGKALTEAVTKMNIDLYPFIPTAFIRRATQILLYKVGGPIFYKKLGFIKEPTFFELQCFEAACNLRRLFLRTFTCPRFKQHRLSEKILRKNYNLPLTNPEVFKHVGPEYLMQKWKSLDADSTQTTMPTTTIAR